MEKSTTKAQSFFTPIGNTKPFFKAAFQGFAGSGKTYTAALVAIGLHKRIGSKKPVIVFDTEESAKFLKPLFSKNGIEALVKASRSLADLKTTFEAMRQGAGDILIIDSISHIWENFLDSYKQKVRRTSLEFRDWGVIKPSWKAEFSDPFVRDPYHVLMTGRAGYEYENEKNEETGKREIYKSGVKMKVEGETAYEPDMLVMMERFEEILTKDDKKVWREATILKDRADIIDGKTIKNPSYDDFAPSVEAMLANPVSIAPGAEVEANAGILFKTEEEKFEWRRERDKALEELEALLVSVAPGQTSNEKKFKVDELMAVFGTASWTAISGLKPDEIREGHLEIIDRLAQRGLVAYALDGTITALAKIEAAEDPGQRKEVEDNLGKSKGKKASVKK